MKSLPEIKAENAGYGDWVRWKEFAGTKKEQEFFGKVTEVKDGVLHVKHTISYETESIVHREKITSVSRD